MKKPVTVMRNELISMVQCLEDDSVRVILAIAQRLKMGREQYGDLHIARDPRDWTKEAHEEALDLAAYLAIATLRREG